MITVHHLENSRSQRVLWLLEELGEEYEVKRYERDAQTNLAPAALLEVHPLGKSPVVTDGDRTIAESGAIIEFLLERYGKGRLAPPYGSPEYDQYRYWLHFAEGSLMPLLVMTLIFHRVENAKLPFFVRPVARAIANKVRGGYLNPNITRMLRYMDNTLSGQAWFAGDEFTAADIQMSFPVEAAEVRAGIGKDYPHLQRFLDAMRARPAYARAIEKGGPYALGASYRADND